jgi:hypothetical protein
MKKSLSMIGAALLLAGVAACNRGGGNGSDDDRLNKAASQLEPDNGVYDTSADDASVNVSDVDPGEANVAAPANTAAGNAASNAQ